MEFTDKIEVDQEKTCISRLTLQKREGKVQTLQI